MVKHKLILLLAVAALVVPAAALAAAPGPVIPEAVTLPSKIVQGDTATGSVCLDRVPATPTEVLLFTDNSFAATVDPTSVVISPPDQCANFSVISSVTGFDRELNLIVSAFANETFADAVLPIIPFGGCDLVEVTRADVNRSFSKVTIIATSDEPGAVLTAFAGGIELGLLQQKGDRYTGRFDLNGMQINNVEVQSSLGGCAQRAVPFGNSSVHC